MKAIHTKEVFCDIYIKDRVFSAAKAYYEINDLKKIIKESKEKIKELKPKLAENIQGISYDRQQKIIYQIRLKDKTDNMTGIYLGSVFKRKTCTRFLEHLAKGDLVKTVEAQDNN